MGWPLYLYSSEIVFGLNWTQIKNHKMVGAITTIVNKHEKYNILG